MEDLVTWLRAQLDEDERVAAEMKLGHPWPQHAYSTGFGTTAFCCDADRVLREVEAKRRILGEIVGQVSQMEDQIDNEWGSLKYPTTGPFTSDVLVKLLALPYADRPGYQEEWKP